MLESSLRRMRQEMTAEIEAIRREIPQAAAVSHVVVQGTEEKEEARQADIARQREAVRTSRQSISNLVTGAVNMTFHQSDLRTPSASPLRPLPPRQSTAAFERRLTQGDADIAVGATIRPFEIAALNKDKFQRYQVAAKQLSISVQTFHGNSTKDGGRTVQEFVRLINAEMDAWWGVEAQMGRLHLVASRTEGIAQNWMTSKREDLRKLCAAGMITVPELTEWCEVQDDFIAEMSKGVSSTTYEAQLRTMKLKNRDNQLDPSTFITRFEEISTRLYPPNTWTNENDRSRMLAMKLEERVKYGGDKEVWATMMLLLSARGIGENDRTVQNIRDALLAACTVEEGKREGRDHRKPYPPSKSSQIDATTPYKQHTANTMAQQPGTANNASDNDDDNTNDYSDEGKPQQVAAINYRNSNTNNRKKYRNPHISQDDVLKLIKKTVCLSCYKKGHFSDKCSTPANRPPTAEELKA